MNDTLTLWWGKSDQLGFLQNQMVIQYRPAYTEGTREVEVCDYKSWIIIVPHTSRFKFDLRGNYGFDQYRQFPDRK